MLVNRQHKYLQSLRCEGRHTRHTGPFTESILMSRCLSVARSLTDRRTEESLFGTASSRGLPL